MDRKPGIVIVAIAISLGFVLSTAIVAGRAIVAYWADRLAALAVVGLVAAMLLLVAGVVRRRHLAARRRRRFETATNEAAGTLDPGVGGAWVADLGARRSAGRTGGALPPPAPPTGTPPG